MKALVEGGSGVSGNGKEQKARNEAALCSGRRQVLGGISANDIWFEV